MSRAFHTSCLCVFFLACTGGSTSPNAPDDAGTASALDASLAEDAAVERDAAVPPDAAVMPPDGGGATDAAVTLDAAVPEEDVVYPTSALQSPITPVVARSIQAIAARNVQATGNVFSKIGDSNTVATGFLNCFAGTHVNLDGRTQLQPTLDFFKAGMAGTTTPYDRVSLCATVGWSAIAAISGNPTPLSQEVDAVHPRYAVVMYGSNDIQLGSITNYASNMLTLTDALIERGVVPLLTSVPPRDDLASADLDVPRYNLVVRGIAQSRRIPFLDLEQALRMLPGHGIGPDGLHLNTYFPSAGVRGCDLTATGLAYGNNTRNLLTLTALDRARHALENATATDPPAAPRRGTGTRSDPFLVDTLPFTDWQDTTLAPGRNANAYSCAPTTNEAGPEYFYKLTLTQPATVEFRVFDQGSVDIDLQLLDATGDPAACVARNDKFISASLTAGDHVFTADSYVSGGMEHAGPYLLTVMQAP